MISVLDRVGGLVLTGGGGARLGGVDKAGIEIGGRTLLQRTLDALGDVAEVVVVGPEATTVRPVTFTREDPPGGGPAAGVLAGLAGFVRRPELVVVLAVDMPMVTGRTVRRLVSAAASGDGAVLVDPSGRRQYLCAAYSVAALEQHAAGDGHGLAMRSLVAPLALVEVPAVGREADDVDTWSDLRELSKTGGCEPLHGGHGRPRLDP